MGEVVVQKLNELQQLDPNIHWFCPRSSAGDYESYLDEDILLLRDHQESGRDKSARSQRVQEAEERRDAALEACKIFAFDGSDAKPYQDQFGDALAAQLGRCDICVREFHRARHLLVQRLEADFDADEVEAFMKTFDGMNIRRITEGLDRTTEVLLELPPDERGIKSIGDAGMYALFEALNCIPFLRNEDALQQHFDKPFRLVQTKKKLKLPTYAPGMISFLYSYNQDRSMWAVRNVESLKRQLTGQEFDYSVKPFFEHAMTRVHILALDRDFLPAFWRGTRLIVFKLSKDLVTNKLRPMDSNLYTIALEHFQIDGNHFSDLLNSYQRLIELSPRDFWEALGTINAQAIADTIFRSPNLQRLLKMRDERENLHLEDKMEWAVVLVRSITPGNIVSPVRSMLEQLLRHFQKDEYSRYAQSVTWTKGLTCLLTALKMVGELVKAGPLTANMIQVVARDHLDAILLELTGAGKKTEMQITKDEQLCLDIIEQTLRMDTAALVQDRATISRTASMEHELHVSGLDMWRRSMKLVRRGYPAIATSVLSGIEGILPLEQFTSRQAEKALKPANGWNAALSRALGYVSSDLLDRLDAFEYEDVLEVVQDPKGLGGIIRLLFNGDRQIHQGAVSVLKILSEAEDRRGCLMHVLTVFYATAMPAINSAMDDLAKARCFQPCSSSLKVCTDIFNCLCDSSDGLLRSNDSPQGHSNLLEAFWMRTWQLLGMIFQETEPWSNMGYDKQAMQDFCREAMDLADHTFEQYSVIASSLQDEAGKGSGSVKKRLLEHARSKFSSISRWLRLRDDYLIEKAVGLTVKILGRLREVDIKIDEPAAQYLEDIVTGPQGKRLIKTRLTMQQKAALRRALEKHLGESLSDTIDLDALDRPKTQKSLEEWASSGRSSGASTPGNGASRSSKPGTIDVEAWSEAAKRRKEIEDFEDDGMKKIYGSMNASERLAQKKKEQQERQKKSVLSSASLKAAQKQQENKQDFLAKRKQAQAEAERNRLAAAAKAKGVGIGSGVAGLGDLGKDHSLKGQNVMVSSDEESEDDEDGLDEDLFGPALRKKVERPNVDPNGAVGLKPEQKAGPTKIQRTARSARDMRARLAPDLTSLHRVILSWDFFHTGDYPPGMNENIFRQVANSFTDPTTYQQTFQPLLTLEAWQGLAKAREENSSKPYEVKVANRTNVDSFIEISSIVGHAENRELQLQESDIILLSKAKGPAQDATAPHCLARIYRVKRQKAHCEVVYQLLPGSSLAPSLAGQTVVWGLKVQSITPLEREYGALQALQYYDLCTQIIRARPSKRMTYTEKQITDYQDIWNVNKAQSEAINAALVNEGFSLIQGPPGSGKTKTIVAIVGGLLTQTLSPSSSGTKISAPGGRLNGNGSLDAPPRKLLVCAPSNAAVDELVMRLKDGVKTKNGRAHQLNIVRIGRSDAINTQVKDVTMDELVSKRLGNSDVDQKKRERNAELFKEHERVSAHLRELYQKRDSGTFKGQELADLETELGSMRKRKNELGIRIDNAKDQERNAGREAELNRKKAQQAVLDEAHVICATLSGSGHDMFQSLNIEFETVIIDEAAQCVEMSSLIPLKYGCVKCIMVGDPKQLPPTVFSKEAAKFQYEQSLFVRMQNNFSNEVHLLDTQYRMHPDISTFPSQTFYDGLLKDGRGMLELRQRPWHASSMLAPYRFFDVAGQHQSAPQGHSLINIAEIDIAMALYDRLRSDFSNYDYNGRIGIITPYKSQLRMLKDRFAKRYGSDILNAVEFNTTDAFQGRESEIIIFSCVRASPAGGIGFLQDIRRMNVGLTRAKSSLWVLGNSQSLIRGQFWKKLVEDAKARECYTTGNLKAMLAQPSSSFPAQRGAALRSMPDAGAHVPQMQPSRETASSDVLSEQEQGGMNGDTNSSSFQTALDSDRMEGISYKFADRITKKPGGSPGVGSDHSTPQSPYNKISDTSAEPPDVEMSNADAATSRGATPGSNYSGAETSLSTGGENQSNPADGNVKPRAGAVARPVAPVVRKRPAASPFMPPRKHIKKP